MPSIENPCIAWRRPHTSTNILNQHDQCCTFPIRMTLICCGYLLHLQSDVWALGCCVFEMTTLKHAFNAKDMNSLVYKILRGKVRKRAKCRSVEIVVLWGSPPKIWSWMYFSADHRGEVLYFIFISSNLKSESMPSVSRVRVSSHEGLCHKSTHIESRVLL